MRNRIFLPSGCFRSSAMARLLRLSIRKGAETPLIRGSRYWRESSPPLIFSTLITSAPMSASIMPQVGPAMICASSMTRIPASAPLALPGEVPVDDCIAWAPGRVSASLEAGLFLGQESAVAAAEVFGVKAVERLVAVFVGKRLAADQIADEFLVPAGHERGPFGDPARRGLRRGRGVVVGRHPRPDAQSQRGGRLRCQTSAPPRRGLRRQAPCR